MQLKCFLLLVAFAVFTVPMLAQSVSKHKVEKGETLYKIAVKYNITIDELKATNPKIASGVKVGDVVAIPTRGKSSVGVSVKLENTPVLPGEKIDLSKVKPSVTDNKTKAEQKSSSATTASEKEGNGGKSVQQAVKEIISEKGKANAASATAEAKTPIKTMSDSLVVKPTASKTASVEPKPIKHRVGAGETLYSIAKMYNQNITSLQTWNKLPDLTVKPGQDVIVEWVIPSGEALVKVANKSGAAAASANKTTSKPLSAFERKYRSIENDGLGMYRKITQTGIATWFDDAGASSSSEGNMYALHRTAPLRSIIKVSNPMNKKSVYVMVIERLPNTINNENVTMSITKSAAKKLGILDEKSIVECKYYIIK